MLRSSAGLGGEQGRMRPSSVAQALAFLLMVLAVSSALNAVHGLQVACQQSTSKSSRLPRNVANSRALVRITTTTTLDHLFQVFLAELEPEYWRCCAWRPASAPSSPAT